MDQKQQLDDQLRAYTDKKRYKKRQIRELQEDLQVRQLRSHVSSPAIHYHTCAYNLR